MKINYHPLLR